MDGWRNDGITQCGNIMRQTGVGQQFGTRVGQGSVMVSIKKKMDTERGGNRN